MRTRAIVNKLCSAAAALLMCALLAGCVNTGAEIDPSCTIPPKLTPSPSPAPSPSPVPAPVGAAEMTDLTGACDRLGAAISTADHFQRYITFENIQVYEQHDDTFMDASAVNEYPANLVCAVNIIFFDDEDNVIAESRVQARDGRYVLTLKPGENALFAQIDTDMQLTDKKFVLEFSDELDVLPE